MTDIERTRGQVATIVTNNGYTVLVDHDDLAWLSALRWRVTRVGSRRQCLYVQSSGRQFMHRLIVAAPAGTDVDHRNGDGLDNRRSNLRITTRRLNSANARPQTGRSSRFKGVCFDKHKRKWVVYITVDARQRFLGYFVDEEDAARAYDAAAIAQWGEFARPNFPPAVSA